MQAENFEIAARLTEGEDRLRLLEQAAMWRRRGFELQMLRFERAREIPDDGPAGDPPNKYQAD